MDRNFLRETLAEESRAYGFTIAFWGSGVMLIKLNGLPSLPEAMLYGLGAVIGFAFLTIYTFSRKLPDHQTDKERTVVLGMVHYLSALVPIAAAYLLSDLESPLDFFLTGISVSLLYNLGMLIEESLNEKAMRLEKEIFRKL